MRALVVPVVLGLGLLGVGAGARAAPAKAAPAKAARAKAAPAKAAPAKAAPADLLYLNHFFTVLDAETMQAIEADPTVRELAATERRTTHADGTSWTGFYVYGEDVDVELFGPGGMSELALGDSGVAFGVDSPGGIDRLVERVRGAGIEIDVGERVKEADGRRIPWFRYAGVKRAEETTSLIDWVMEYRPDYLTYRLGHAPAVRGDISRKTYLSNMFRPGQLVRSFRRIRFAVPAVDRDAFATAARAYGWTIRRVGETVIAEGPNTTIELVADARRRGLVELVIDLARAPGTPREVRLGRSTLIVGPEPRAVWRFEPVVP